MLLTQPSRQWQESMFFHPQFLDSFPPKVKFTFLFPKHIPQILPAFLFFSVQLGVPGLPCPPPRVQGQLLSPVVKLKMDSWSHPSHIAAPAALGPRESYLPPPGLGFTIYKMVCTAPGPA